MQHIEAMQNRLALGSAATEGGVHRGVDPLLEGALARSFGFPDVDVAQLPVRLANTQVQKLSR